MAIGGLLGTTEDGLVEIQEGFLLHLRLETSKDFPSQRLITV